jgi:hypothetical protein
MKSGVQRWYEAVLHEGQDAAEFPYDVLLLRPDPTWLQQWLGAAASAAAGRPGPGLAALLRHCCDALLLPPQQQQRQDETPYHTLLSTLPSL